MTGRRPVLTNDPPNDPHIAVDSPSVMQGLEAFLGLPFLVDDDSGRCHLAR